VAVAAATIVALLAPYADARESADTRAGLRAARCPSSAAHAHWIAGYVHTCGQRLIDAGSHEVRLLSLEETAMGWGSGTHDTDVCGRWQAVGWKVTTEIRHWGLNSVELFISWANLEPRPPTIEHGKLVHHWNITYLRAVDNAIKRFSSRGVSVVLVMHQSRWSAHFRNLKFPDGSPQVCGAGLPAWLYRGTPTGWRSLVRAELQFFANRNHIQDRFARVWQMIARRYRGNPRVIGAAPLFEAYDLIAGNYPGGEHVGPKDLRLAAFYERIGRALHQVNPKLLVVLPDRLSFTAAAASSIDRRPQVPNAVYGFEFFGPKWYPDGQKRMQTYHEQAARWSLPGYVLEFTAFGRTTGDDGPAWKRSTSLWLRFAKHHHVSWSINAGPDDMTPGMVRLLRSGF
jgi:hypothetical protein